MLMQCYKSTETSWMLDSKRQMWVLSGPWALSPRPEAPPGGSEPRGSEKNKPISLFRTEKHGGPRMWQMLKKLQHLWRIRDMFLVSPT